MSSSLGQGLLSALIQAQAQSAIAGQSALSQNPWDINRKTVDYDYGVGSLSPNFYSKDNGHYSDLGKLPNHQSFSNESFYSQFPKLSPLAGLWAGNYFMPSQLQRLQNRQAPVYIDDQRGYRPYAD